MALLKKVKLPEDPGEEPVVTSEDEKLSEATIGASEPTVADEEAGTEPLALDSVSEEDPPAAGESLLDMFTTVGVHVEDRSMLLALAPEIDIDDLVSELNIVAAALGLVQAERGTP